MLYQSSELESSLMVWPGFAGSDVRAPSVSEQCAGLYGVEPSRESDVV